MDDLTGLDEEPRTTLRVYTTGRGMEVSDITVQMWTNKCRHVYAVERARGMTWDLGGEA